MTSPHLHTKQFNLTGDMFLQIAVLSLCPVHMDAPSYGFLVSKDNNFYCCDGGTFQFIWTLLNMGSWFLTITFSITVMSLCPVHMDVPSDGLLFSKDNLFYCCDGGFVQFIWKLLVMGSWFLKLISFTTVMKALYSFLYSLDKKPSR